MRPVWEVLHPYPEVEEGRVTEDSFVISIGGIWERLEYGLKVDVDPRYLDPEGFYRRTHFTDAMKQLIGDVVARLKGEPAQSIHHLKVGMGGGKSHTLLLLYFLSRYRDKAIHYLKREGIADDVPPFRVAVLDGSRLSVTFGKSFPDGSRVLTIWGLLFKQLGVYETFEDADRWEVGPDVSMIKEALAERPTLILIDEITLYVTNLISQRRLADRAQAFIQSLTTAVKETPGCALVVASPMGLYPEGLKLVSDVLGRYCSPTVIAAGREYKRIRKRAMYTDDFDAIAQEVEALAREYEACYRQHLPGRAAVSVEAITDNYPFHPFVDRTLYRLKVNTAFQQVRDELRFLAGLIYSVHRKRDPDTYLISVGDADLQDDYVRGGTITKLRDPILVARLDTDLEERLLEIPEGLRDPSKKVLATIVLNSLAGGSPMEMGVTREDAIYALLTPGSTPALIDEALKQIVRHLWFVNPVGDRYVFGQRNINKILDDYVRKVERDKSLRGRWWDLITSELSRWKTGAVKQYVKTAKDKGKPPLFESEDIQFWPNRSDEIPDDNSIKLIFTDYTLPLTSVISEEDLTREERTLSIRQRVASTPEEACDAVRDLYNTYGQTPRNYKNTVFFLVADRNLVEKNGPVGYTKQLMALEEMLKDREGLQTLIGEPGIKAVERLKADTIRDLRPSCVAAYRFLVYPSGGGLSALELGEERRAIEQFLTLVEERLDDQANKILRSMTTEALLDRYWPKRKERVEVRDLVEGFYRRPEIEVIESPKVVEDAVRKALRDGRIAYSYQNEVYYGREPLSVDGKGILVKNPEVITVTVEAVDEKGDILSVRLNVDGKKEAMTPTTIPDLRGVSKTIRPLIPTEMIFKGWRDGFQVEERTVNWDKSKTIVLQFEHVDILVAPVSIEVSAIDTKANTSLDVTVSIDGITYQTPAEASFPRGKRCSVKAATPKGMTFQGWSDGNSHLERVVFCEYDLILTAYFAPVTPGAEIIRWAGPIPDGVKNVETMLDRTAKHARVKFAVDYDTLSRSLGAMLQLMKQSYTIEVEASGGSSLGFQKLMVSAKAESDQKGSVRSCLTQLKGYLDAVAVKLEKTEEDYKPLNQLLSGDALEALEKIKGTMDYELHVLSDTTRKPEPQRTLKGLISEFKRVG